MSHRPTLPSLFALRNSPVLKCFTYGHASDLISQLMHAACTACDSFDPSIHADVGFCVASDGTLHIAVTTLAEQDDSLPEGVVWLVRGLHNMTLPDLHRKLEAKMLSGLAYSNEDANVRPHAVGMFVLGGWVQTVSGQWVLITDIQGAGLATVSVDHLGTKRYCFGMAAGAVLGHGHTVSEATGQPQERTGMLPGSHPDDVLPSVRMSPDGWILGRDGARLQAAPEQVQAPAWEAPKPAEVHEGIAEHEPEVKPLGDPGCVQPVESGKCGGDCGSCPNGG